MDLGELTDLMRADLGLAPGLTEKRMFGGICFLLHGNMVSAISPRNAMYRVGKAREDESCMLEGVEPMIHGGRRMGGFVTVEPGVFLDDGDLRTRLTDMALLHAAGLPPKDG